MSSLSVECGVCGVVPDAWGDSIARRRQAMFGTRPITSRPVPRSLHLPLSLASRFPFSPPATLTGSAVSGGGGVVVASGGKLRLGNVLFDQNECTSEGAFGACENCMGASLRVAWASVSGVCDGVAVLCWSVCAVGLGLLGMLPVGRL